MSLDKGELLPPAKLLGPNRNWSPRWVELRPHVEQLRLWHDQTRFKLVSAGRRSGKTELAKRRLVEHLFRRTWHGQPGRYFAAAPTIEQAKRIFWDDLKALILEDWIGSINETDLRIETTKGAHLWVHGMERPERVEGSPWDGCVIDEIANCKPTLWDAHIRPALADRRGWAWLIGVPDVDSMGQEIYEGLVVAAQSGANEEWRCFNWPSSDILSPEEIESARRRLDPLIFEQEYLGRFVGARGSAFANFDPAIHVKPTAYDPSLHICWSLDFNVNPMCSGVLQHNRKLVRVIEEFSLPNADTDTACEVFLERAMVRGWNLRDLAVYGDASGSARHSNASESDWDIVRQRLGHLSPRMNVPASNPRVKDTMNAVRAVIRSAGGGTRLSIDPKCIRLIRDLRQSPAGSNGMAQEPYHALAWLRYFVWWEYPIERPVRVGGAGIGFSKLQREP